MKSSLATDNEDTSDSLVPRALLSAQPSIDIFQPVTHPPNPRYHSRETSPESEGPGVDDIPEDIVVEFDFEEWMNTKRKSMGDKEGKQPETEKDAVPTEEMEQGKKPFVNGIDMFAEGVSMGTENTDVSENDLFAENMVN